MRARECGRACLRSEREVACEQWANGHPPFNLWAWLRFGDLSLSYLKGGGGEGAGEARRAAKGAGGGAETRGGGGQAVRGCEAAEASPRELFGTLVVVAATVTVSAGLRVVLNWVVRKLRERHAKKAGEEALPFPVFELQVLLLFFLGLAEGAAEGLASRCGHYEAVSAVVLLGLLLFTLGMSLVVGLSLFHKIVAWDSQPLREGWRLARHKVEGVKGRGLVRQTRHIYEAWLILKQRGEWTVHPEETPIMRKYFGPRFADRMGALFDSYKAGAWWFGFWTMTSAFVSALIMTNVLDPLVNAALITAVGATDTVVVVLFQPDADWSLFVMHTWTSLCNLASLSSALAFLAGMLSPALCGTLFFYLQTLSILPLSVVALLRPIAGVLRGLARILSCTFLSTPLSSVYAVGAGASAVAVSKTAAHFAAGNDDLHQVSGRQRAATEGETETETETKAETETETEIERGRKSNCVCIMCLCACVEVRVCDRGPSLAPPAEGDGGCRRLRQRRCFPAQAPAHASPPPPPQQQQQQRLRAASRHEQAAGKPGTAAAADRMARAGGDPT